MENRKDLIYNYVADLQIHLLNGGFTRCRPDWGYQNLKPEYNKMYFICDGEGWIRIHDQDVYPAPGQFVFIPAGTLHSFSTVSSNTYTKYWCHFTSNVMFSPLFQYYGLPYVMNTEECTGIAQAFHRMEQTLSWQASSMSLRVKSAIYDIISCFIDHCVSTGIKSVAPASVLKLQKVTEYIDQHMDKDIKIEQLADIMHFNTNYLYQFMKMHLGITPMQYIYKRRLDKAKDLLINTDDSLANIAAVTGFSDVYHFSKSFKKHTGISPRAYRNGAGRR
ncbi:AraC family transcriptional regulator [Paenibacillus vulneris]|uniref:AraC family transcriptional regulator n=1 Tax=Paenibacillus vulneris TaxID=1133364 RepID=A0ABW3UND0_9BACL